MTMKQCEAKITVIQKGVLAPFYARCIGAEGHTGMHYWEQEPFSLVAHRLHAEPLWLHGAARIGWDDPEIYGAEAKAYILDGLTVSENGNERAPELTVQPYEVQSWSNPRR